MRLGFLQLTFLLMLPHLALANAFEVTSENIRRLLEAKNPKFSASRLSTQAAKEREGAFLRSFLPSIEVYGTQESFRLGSNPNKNQPAYGAQATLNLFNGGRDFLENEIRGLETEKRNFGSQKIFSEELEKARASYWKILYLEEKIKLMKATLSMNQKNLTSALKRIKSGVATNSDRFEFEMKEVELKRELAEIELKVQTDKLLLALLLGLEAGNLAFPEKLSHDHAYENLLKHIASDHDFLFKENEIQSEQQKLNAKKLRRAWWPKIDAYAAYHQFNEREKEFAAAADRKETVLGLKLSIALGAGLESALEAKALGKEALAFSAVAEFEQAEVEVHFENEKAELKLLHDQVHEAEENINRAESYYGMTQAEYSRGAKNSPDVLGASEKLFDMQNKRLEIIHNFQIAKAHVLSKIGK